MIIGGIWGIKISPLSIFILVFKFRRRSAASGHGLPKNMEYCNFDNSKNNSTEIASKTEYNYGSKVFMNTSINTNNIHALNANNTKNFESDTNIDTISRANNSYSHNERSNIQKTNNTITNINNVSNNSNVAITIPQTMQELTELLLVEMGNDGLKEPVRIMEIMQSYVSNSDDWKQFALFDPHKYTRNLVSAGNGHFNLMVLCWGPDQQSPIHDHSDAHCIVKMLDGELTESLFSWPDAGNINHNDDNGKNT